MLNHQTQKLKKPPFKKHVDIVWILAGQDVGTFFYLVDQAIIGRSPECDVVINDSYISRKHIAITQRNNDWYLTDLSTTNGSILNNQPMAFARVQNGDLLELGETKCLVLSVQMDPRPEGVLAWPECKNRQPTHQTN